MAKMVRCSNIVPGCTFIATGKTAEEVLRRASEHVRVKHKLRGMSPEVIAVIHGAIQEDGKDRDPSSIPRHGTTECGW
ncbi:MAG TPA: DUF1059 domain-containing protein [Candidatus Acidoferrales bacterium]|nr:DUF1059 domain-containing protein [Candidatus Acidoferrales bacterium]